MSNQFRHSQAARNRKHQRAGGQVRQGTARRRALLRVTCYHCYRSEPGLGQKRTAGCRAGRGDRDGDRAV